MNTIIEEGHGPLGLGKDDDDDFLEMQDSKRVSVDLSTVTGTGGDDSDRTRKET
jgi:hypothetical protein